MTSIKDDDIFTSLFKDSGLDHIDDVYREKRDENSPLSRTEIEDFLPRQPTIISVLPQTSRLRAFVIRNTTVLMPLDDILPECGYLTRESRIPRMVCVADPGQCRFISENCPGKLLNRLGKIAAVKEDWKLYILYWRLYVEKSKDKDRRFGLLIWADTSNMSILPLNICQLDYFITRRSKKFEIEMTL